ncbi:wax ester/triacylglycerol synthase domain-containing protein [Streptomyces flaveolus]|uniref:wax ester/triacylglycerol synthase domain-containing protein n=1 Tax=Streptomyces flaveolus TaxID=67297 RepID=UPI00342F7FF1
MSTTHPAAAAATAQGTDLITTAFLGLGTLTPDPSDMYFGFHLRMRGTGPDLETLRSHIAERAAGIALLTHRLTLEGGGRWEPDDAFDIACHVRQAPGDGLEPRPAQALIGTPPDESRPRWFLWLHPGDGEEWALTYLAHHAVQDATSMAHTLHTLLGPGDVPVGAAPPARPPRGRRKATALLPLLPDMLATFLPRAAAPVFPESSGPRRALGHAAVDLSLLSDMAHATGATVNQVHIAALATALRRWPATRDHADRRAWRSGPHLVVPVDLRTGPGENSAHPRGNNIGLLRVPLPRAAGDLAGRRDAMGASLGRRYLARRRCALRTLTEHASPRLAGWVLKRVTDPHGLLLTASQVRPVATPSAALGAPVTEVTALPWLPPGNGCFTILTTHEGVARLSVLTSSADADPQALARLWAAALGADRSRLA